MISNSVIIDVQVFPEVTTTHPLHSKVVSGAAVEPAGGATRKPDARGMATQAARKCEKCMAVA